MRRFLRYPRSSGAFAVCFLAVLFFSLWQSVDAGSIHNYSDTLSNSGPGEYSNHTVQFKTTQAIMPGGTIRVRPDEDNFAIPATDFDIDNIELLVSTSSTFVLRAATTAPSAFEDGISWTTGSSSVVEITLNSTIGIPANSFIKVRIGNHTTNATTTDLGILNPGIPNTYPIYIETVSGTSSMRARSLVAIVDKVTIPSFSTREFDPPVRFNGAPSGTLSGTTLAVQMSLETDEFARCRYTGTPDTPYFSMGNEFTTNFAIVHAKNIAVATGTTYTFYIRCIDDEGNLNTDDYVITFTIPEFPPGEPGPGGTNEGQGSGTGEGSGDADPGSGDPTGGDDTSGGTEGGGGGGGGGGGSGPSSGGGGGGGGFEGTNRPYQSGDGRVIINGYAFPRSEVYVLVDGAQTLKVTAGTAGDFSAVIDEIARGVYTFGVYGVDRNGTRSSTFSTTFTVTGSRGSTLSNINVMPSIKVTPDPVNPGSTVTFSGYAIPNASITVENQNDKSSVSLKTFTTSSDSNGAWSVSADTTGFTPGTYKVRAKAKQESGISTNFSDYTYYGVGQAAQLPRTSDLNRDGKVNLTDFSILLFWWNSDGGNSNPPADINGDGRVSLTDFSIMIFNWTG
jgi:hypothetical protein